MVGQRGRILCAEDNADTRDLISVILTAAGFEVVCTERGDEALELARSQRFHLYLIDNWMPGLSGTELVMKLREFDVRTPILFYSGNETDKEVARLAGAQGYLVKPVASDDPIAEIARLIGEDRNASDQSI